MPVQEAAPLLYRSEFIERYRLWKGLERLATEARQGRGADIETIAREERTRAEWLTSETAMDLLCHDIETGEIRAQYLEHNARRLGLDPASVQAELTRRRDLGKPLQPGSLPAEPLFTGSVLAFDPGDVTGWALLRLAGPQDVREGRAEREGEPIIEAAGAFLVDGPAGEGWSNGPAELEAMRAQMLAALAVLAALASDTAPPIPRLPELARRGVRAGEPWETRRSEPGEACAALIREFRPSIVACEWIYRVFPKGKRVETPEGPIMKSGMSASMTTGLYRAGVIGGAIRAAARAAGLPFVHLSAASWRRAIVGNYRAKDREIAKVITRVRRVPLRSWGVSLSTSHPRDAVGAGLFALSALLPAEQAPIASKGSEAGGEQGQDLAPRRRPGRPRKAVDPSAPVPVKRPRGRPRKVPLDASAGPVPGAAVEASHDET